LGESPRPVRARRTRRSVGADTLPLLATPLHAPPLRIRPEAAIPCSGPFDADQWRFSIDWDGARTLLVTGPQGEAALYDARLRDVTALYPEVVHAAAALGRRRTVLDGVVSVLDGEGRPDLEALSLRVRAGPRATVPGALVFLAGDLLHLDGSSTATWSLDRRHDALGILVPPQPRLQVPGWVAGHGRAFCEAASEHGLSSVLARRGDAPYRAGVASPDRLRIALEERVDAVVVGIVHGSAPDARPRRRLRVAVDDEGIAALLLGEWVDGRLCEAGRLAGPWPDETAIWLWARAAELIAPPPAGMAAAGETVTWLRPGVVATVRHHGRDEAGRLRLPATVALRDDIDPAWCIRRPPVPPPAETPLPSGFRPTVLSTLPFGD